MPEHPGCDGYRAVTAEDMAAALAVLTEGLGELVDLGRPRMTLAEVGPCGRCQRRVRRYGVWAEPCPYCANRVT